jgi:hypothetical protein
VRAALALSALAFFACSRQQPERHVTAARPAPADAGPPAKPAVTTQGADISWLVGMWERQTSPKEWLLFNAPKEVGVLSGKPPSLTQRGEFIPTGRSVSLFFRGVGGSTVERVLEASADYTELHESGNPPATYRRGAPP